MTSSIFVGIFNKESAEDANLFRCTAITEKH